MQNDSALLKEGSMMWCTTMTMVELFSEQWQKIEMVAKQFRQTLSHWKKFFKFKTRWQGNNQYERAVLKET